MRACRCSPDQIQRYRSRLSGPLLDRIDLQVAVPRLAPGQLTAAAPNGELPHSTAKLRRQVIAARQRQLQRGALNHQLSGREAEAATALTQEQRQWLESAIVKLGLSARVYHRVLKVARTLTDLDGRATVEQRDLREALQYRSLDREPA